MFSTRKTALKEVTLFLTCI